MILPVATQTLKLTAGIAVLAYVGYQLAAALAKGYFPKGNSNGGGCVYRQKEPIQYWVRIVLMTVFCALGLWILLAALGWAKV
jgi:hypothetical protein